MSGSTSPNPQLEEFCGPHNMTVTILGRTLPVATIQADYLPWDDCWWIARCYVAPASRNSGLGTQVMERMCQLLDKRGARATLIPNPYNESIDLDRLIAFYERFGFVRTSNESGEIWAREACSSVISDAASSGISVDRATASV